MRKSLSLLLAGALVLLGVLSRPLWTGRVSVYFDLGVFHLPLRHFYAQCLQAGEPFDWMPSMHGGLFLTGEGEHGPYHPLHLALFRFLPLDTAFAAECFLAYPLMLLGTFVFLRRHAGTAGALLGSLIYTFSANNVSHAIHPNYVAVLAHLPWLLWLLERVARTTGPSCWLAAASVALLTGSQVLLGHPQALSWSLLAEGLYALFLVKAAPRPVRAGLIGSAAKLLGLAIGGVQLLATLAFLRNSNRASFDPMMGGLPPSRLVQLLVPNVLGLDRPGWRIEPAYFGAVPLVLLAWWLLWGRFPTCQPEGRLKTCPTPAYFGAVPLVRLVWWLTWGRFPTCQPEGRLKTCPTSDVRLTWYAIVLGVLATWLALGSDGGLYRLHTHLPVLGQFRAPGRYMNLAGFAAAVLAGLAFGRLTERVCRRQPLPGRHLVLPWALVAAALAAAVVLHFAIPPDDSHGFDRRFLSGPLTLAAAAGALTLAVRGRILGLHALVVLAALDLYHFCLCNPVWGEPLWRRTTTLDEWKATTKLPPQPGAGRVLYLHWEPGRLLLRGERLLNGYRGGLEPRKELDYTQLAALQVAGAAWYHEAPLGSVPVPAGLEAAGAGWYRVPAPLPRVRLVGRVLPSTDPARDLGAIDPATTALTTHPLDLDELPAGTAVLAEERPGRLRIDMETAGRQLLVVAESHDPGWQVQIDGTPAAVERVNGDFLGCVVPAGSHTVAFDFCPAVLPLGKALSLAGTAVALVIAGVAGLGVLRARHLRLLASVR